MGTETLPELMAWYFGEKCGNALFSAAFRLPLLLVLVLGAGSGAYIGFQSEHVVSHGFHGALLGMLGAFGCIFLVWVTVMLALHAFITLVVALFCGAIVYLSAGLGYLMGARFTTAVRIVDELMGGLFPRTNIFLIPPGLAVADAANTGMCLGGFIGLVTAWLIYSFLEHELGSQKRLKEK
jgi:hypothetical protein